MLSPPIRMSSLRFWSNQSQPGTYRNDRLERQRVQLKSTVGSQVVAPVASKPGCRPQNIGELVQTCHDPFNQQAAGELRRRLRAAIAIADMFAAFGGGLLSRLVGRQESAVAASQAAVWRHGARGYSTALLPPQMPISI